MIFYKIADSCKELLEYYERIKSILSDIVSIIVYKLTGVKDSVEFAESEHFFGYKNTATKHMIIREGLLPNAFDVVVRAALHEGIHNIIEIHCFNNDSISHMKAFERELQKYGYEFHIEELICEVFAKKLYNKSPITEYELINSYLRRLYDALTYASQERCNDAKKILDEIVIKLSKTRDKISKMDLKGLDKDSIKIICNYLKERGYY